MAMASDGRTDGWPRKDERETAVAMRLFPNERLSMQSKMVSSATLVRTAFYQFPVSTEHHFQYDSVILGIDTALF